MKTLKIFGLATLIALLATALVGAPSALAEGGTALCTSEGEEERVEEGEITVEKACHIIEHIHETSVGKGKLLTSSLTVECEILYLGDMTGEGLGALTPLTIKGKFTYSNCSNSCTVEEINGPSSIKVLREGHETAKVVGVGEINVKCGALINCTYTSEGLVGTAKGPLLSTQKNGEVSIKEQAVKKIKGICPTSAKLDLTTTPLEASYIVDPSLWLPWSCINVGAGNGWFAGFPCLLIQFEIGGPWKRRWY